MIRAALLALVLLAPSTLAAGHVFSVEMDATEKMAKPQKVVSFQATITNWSPDPLKLSFEIVARDGRLQAATPNGLALAPAGEPQSETKVTFSMQTPYENGPMDETGRITYRVSARDPLTNATRAEPQDVTLVVRTVGTYVPGPQLFGAMFAIGLAALLLRRARP